MLGLAATRGGTARSDLRDFDPGAVARLETDMWRSYYDRDRIALFRQLGELLREQYKMPWAQSWATAWHAAKAAVVFQKGRSRADYERALPDLDAYYAAIQSHSVTQFPVPEAARLELEWWIIHRQRDHYPREALVQSLADLQACLYHLPPEVFHEHAQARAEAMLIRDDRAAHGGVSEADWSRIAGLLDQSWTSLWNALHRT
jgi:hypothetical protein